VSGGGRYGGGDLWRHLLAPWQWRENEEKNSWAKMEERRSPSPNQAMKISTKAKGERRLGERKRKKAEGISR